MILGQLLPNPDLEGSHNNLAWIGENEISQAKKSYPNNGFAKEESEDAEYISKHQSSMDTVRA